MNILRSILIGLMSFVCVITISGTIYVTTLQSTIMNPTVVKSWLKDSKIYDGGLLSLLVQPGQQNDKQPDSPQKIIATSSQVKTALSNTYTPDFIQTQVETMVNNAYAWMDGKTPNFSFSVPIDQKKDVLIQQLAAAIEPQIAALPVCSQAMVAAQTACRPSGETPAQVATELTTQNIQQSSMFNKPITNETLAKNDNSPIDSNKQSLLTQLPSIHQLINQLSIIFPIIALVAIAIIVAIAKSGQRLLASLRLSRRIFFSMILTFIGALVFVWLTRNSDFGLSGVAGQASDALLPLIEIALAGLAKTLAIYSGIVCFVTLAIWIGIAIWLKKHAPVPSETPAIVATEPIPAQVS